jgi:signal transduction histidine kinase
MAMYATEIRLKIVRFFKPYRSIFIIFKRSTPFLFVLFGYLAQAQPSHINFDHISSKDGLPNNWIYSILEDSKGYMWFGTKNGLSRYDGTEFINFTYQGNTAKGLRAYECSNLIEDKHGHIWFINYPHVGYIDTKSLEIRFAEKENGEPLNFFSMCLDSAGNLFACEGSVVHRIQLDSLGKIIQKDTIADLHTSQINQMSFDLDGDLVLASEEDNTFIIQLQTNQIRNYRLPLEADSINWHNIIRCIKVDSKGNIWLGSYNRGLYQLNKKTGEFSKYFYDGPLNSSNIVSNMIRSIEESNFDGGDSELWLATYDKGLVLFDRSSHEFKLFSHDPNNTKSLRSNNSRSLRAGSSILWVGTSHGVDKYDIRNQTYRTSSIVDKKFEEEVRKSFTCLEPDLNCGINHLVWCGSNGGGISLYNTRTGELKSAPDPPFESLNYVNAILHWSTDTLILAGYNGLCIYHIPSEKYEPIQASVFSKNNEIGITESSTRATSLSKINNHSLFFTANLLGAYRYDFKTNKLDEIPDLSGRGIHLEYCGGENYILDRGSFLQRIDKIGNVLEEYKSKDENDLFLNGFIYKTTFDSLRNSLWVSTWVGLGSIDLVDGTRRKYDFQDGLMHERTYDVTLDKSGNVWVITEGGLSVLTPGTNTFRSKRIETISELSLAENPAILYTPSDKLLIGMFNGITSIETQQLLEPLKRDHEVRISALKHANSDWIYDFTDEITFDHEKNDLEFIISCLSYGDPTGNRYSYQLAGQSENWVDIGNQNRITLINLEPGEYSLQVKSTDSYGFESENIARLKITISPAWYQTILFKVLIGFLILGLVLAVYKYRIHQVLKLQEIRNNISRDLHDDIGATLSSANITSSVLQRKSDDPSQTALIMDLRQQLRDAQQALDDIVWNVNPKNDSLEKMLARMRRYATELLDKSGISYHIEFPEEVDSIKLKLEQRRDIYLIFKESINNIAKHSGADCADVKLTYSDGYLNLRIKDNGRGFSSTINSDRNGLSNMKKRSESLKASLQISSSPGVGCEVNLSIRL